ADLPEDLLPAERPKPYLLRAQVRTARKDYAAAEAVLTEALALGGHDLALHLERAKVRELRKDAAGAKEDWAAAAAFRPATAMEWTNRGLARLDAGDPRAALADFDQALALNPAYYLALQNKAHVLSEHFNKPAE